MPGTLVITTLSDGTNSTSSTNPIRGSAKAWVNWNGITTATINSSYNVSSVTRNGTGDYTISFSSNFASTTSYAGAFAAGYTTGTSGNNTMISMCYREGNAPTVSSVRVSTNYANGSVVDAATCCATFFGT